MKDKIQKYYDKKLVTIYPCKAANAPIIYSNDYSEAGEQILTRCCELDEPPFHLVTICHLSWDADLSPWPHGPVIARNDNFKGKADEYLTLMKDEIIPFAENAIGQKITKRILMGYSMAGLFAAYAPFKSDLFDAVISVSGSVWYPDFLDYFMTHPFSKRTKTVYFSLGDKEIITKNSALQKTEDICIRLSEECQKRGIASVFEKNPGNHYTEMVERITKGIGWTLSDFTEIPK